MQVRPKNLKCEAVQFLGNNFDEVGSMVEFLFQGNATRTQTSTVRDGDVIATHDSVTIQLWGRPHRADLGDWIIIDEFNKVVRILSDEWFTKYYEEGE